MNKLKEEGGYTLIIALLLIVLFMGMSAVFVQASLSHATQEQTVDQGNLAVSAAEMGVEKYSKEAENAFAKTYAKVNASALLKKKALEAEVKKYPAHANLNATCLKANKPVMQDWIQCNIDVYDEELRTEFFNEMQTQLSLINKDEVAVSETLTHELASISLLPMTATDKSINLKMDVIGEKSEPNQVPAATKTVLRSKLLPTELNFPEVPFFNENALSEVEVKWGEPLGVVTNFFPQLLDKADDPSISFCPSISEITSDMRPCKYDGVISDEYLAKLREKNINSSFYLILDEFPDQYNKHNAYNIPMLINDGTIEKNTNVNSTENLVMYYKGLLTLQNMNTQAVNNLFVAETIIFHTNQNVLDNTIINIGNKDKTKAIYTSDKITINNGSKLCVNLDGITPNPSDIFTTIINKNIDKTNGNYNLAVEGNGKINLFTKNTVAIPNTENIEYFHDPSKFLEACGVAINYNVEGVEKFGLPLPITDLEWDVDMDVKY